MITLRTLRQASLQEIFDQAARHLLAQNAHSRALVASGLGHESMTCAYRGKGGLKCAIGVFISDDEYRPEWEGKDAEVVCAEYSTPDQLSLLSELQTVHDFTSVDSWRWELAEVASEANLSRAVLDAQP